MSMSQQTASPPPTTSEATPNDELTKLEIEPPENVEKPSEPKKSNSTPDDAPVRPPPEPEPEGVKMDSGSRWSDVVLHARGKITHEAALSGKNDVKSRWRRAVFLANRLANGRSVVTSGNKYDLDDKSSKSEKAKILETQHWLELIDPKHRYGSNLKYYHRRWIDDDTKENFFQWLDQGGGKDLDLEQCPRERLESERIIYLSSEQRLNYLTKIDSQGRLRWARNDKLVDSTPNRWKDAGEGRGIIPTTGDEDDRHDPKALRRSSFDTIPSSIDTSSSSISSRAKHHYSGKDADKSKISQFFQKHFTMKGVTEKMLRKTLRKNTWIYVCDVNYNMFVGIKQTGTFQHSSFFGGSVSSAGLLTIKDGLVTSLSPLSGHYRTDIPYFESFIKAMSDRGLDLHKIHITKEEAVLWGVSHWGKFSKTKGTFIKERKQKVKEEVKKVGKVMTGESLKGDKGSKKEVAK